MAAPSSLLNNSNIQLLNTNRKFAAAKKAIRVRESLLQRIKSKREVQFTTAEENVFASSYFEDEAEDNWNVMQLLDLSYFTHNAQTLKSCFPPHFLHTFAAKANPIPNVLSVMAENGLGVECASKGELSLALCVLSSDPSKVIFDSPSKSMSDLRFALKHKVPLNIDNYQELLRVHSLLLEFTSENSNFNHGEIGVRVNTQVGEGSLKGFSTASKTSKFGIALNDDKELLINSILKHPFITMLHCHVGSQGCDFELMMKGIKATTDLANEINERAKYQQITTIDIGGGLSVNFSSEEMIPSFQDYACTLSQAVPDLFSGKYYVITEFGRSLIAKTGYTLCSVEYTKTSGGMNFANVQTGADMFIRTIYHPDKWPLRVTVLDKNGDVKPMEGLQKYNISGPCCIGMDIIAHERLLPEINPGDYLLVHDTGGYYHSSFSYYNSRKAPIFVGFEDGSPPSNNNVDVDSLQFKLLCAAQPLSETIHFFSRQ